MGVGIPTQFEVAPGRFFMTFALPVTDMTKIANGDVVTTFTPGFPGRIKNWYWVQNVACSTADKLSTLNLEIGTVNVETTPGTNSTISLTTVACNTVGKVVAGTGIGLHNSFSKTDTVSVEASATTTFGQGAGVIMIVVEGKIL